MMLNHLQSGLLFKNKPGMGLMVTSGGVIDQLGYEVLHSFFETENLVVTRTGKAKHLLIPGGGGGGQRDGGGGGGGKSNKGSSHVLIGNNLVTVGAAGLGATSTIDRGSHGGDTTFNGNTAKGGGGGATGNTDAGADALTGQGNGGGGAGNGWNGVGATSLGNKGGDAGGSPYYGAGGGAGDTQAGSNGTGTTGGDGGDGLTDDFDGVNTTYCSGGGGGVGQIGGTNTGGTGGDGAGNGGSDLGGIHGTNATGYGSGGGGSAYNGNGGNGREGVAFIKYTGTLPMFTGIGSLGSNSSFASGSNGIFGIHISKDGHVMTAVDYDNDKLYFYRLATPYDLTTASYDFRPYFSTLDTPMGIDYSNDGMIAIVSSYSNSNIARYNLSAPYDFTGVSGTPIATKSMTGGKLLCPKYSKDGTKFYISDGDYVYEYSLSTTFDITTMSGSPTSSKQLGSTTANNSFSFDYNGKWLFAPLGNDNTIQCIKLGTPWDLSTAGSSSTITNPSGSSAWSGCQVSANNRYLYLCHYGASNYVYRTTITPN